jgi:hypothetical protein
LLDEVQHRLRTRLLPGLRVAIDVLAYLEEREESQATAELLRMPGLEEAMSRALQEAGEGDVVRSQDARRDAQRSPL